MGFCYPHPKGALPIEWFGLMRLVTDIDGETTGGEGHIQDESHAVHTYDMHTQTHVHNFTNT